MCQNVQYRQKTKEVLVVDRDLLATLEHQNRGNHPSSQRHFQQVLQSFNFILKGWDLITQSVTVKNLIS